MRIVVTDLIGIPESAKDQIRELGGEVYNDRPKNKEEVLERLKDAEIITANYINIGPDIMDAIPNLKYIIVPAVGFDWIDHEYATKKGIKILNCPTYVSLAVAEHALTLIFASARRLLESNADFKNGVWNPNKYDGVEIHGKKLGLVGYGNIGKSLERLAAAIGMQVEHVNSKSSDAELDELLETADIICICLPLSEKTRHLIDERRLGLLKPSAFLVNVARGAIVDQKALIQILEKNKIAGAGLDVFAGEPLTGEPSEEILKLINLPNVVATPHIAYNTAGALERLGGEIVDNIKACLNGKPQNIVN